MGVLMCNMCCCVWLKCCVVVSVIWLNEVLILVRYVCLVVVSFMCWLWCLNSGCLSYVFSCCMCWLIVLCVMYSLLVVSVKLLRCVVVLNVCSEFNGGRCWVMVLFCVRFYYMMV